MNKELDEIEKLKRQLASEYADNVELRRENYFIKLKNRVLKKQWEEMYEANYNLVNTIKSFDRFYFEKIEGLVEEEGKSDYKGVQV